MRSQGKKINGKRANKQISRRPRFAGPTGKTAMVNQSFFDSLTVRLSYTDQTLVRKNTSSYQARWSYRANSVYDPDYTGTGGQCSGFNEYAAMYYYYRVIRVHYDVQLSNLESFPILVALAPTSIDYVDAALDLSELPYGKKAILSAKGGQDRCRLRGSVSMTDVVGESTVLYSDNYSSQVTTNPTFAAFLCVALNADGANTLTNGVFASIRLQYDVTFYKKKQTAV